MGGLSATRKLCGNGIFGSLDPRPQLPIAFWSGITSGLPVIRAQARDKRNKSNDSSALRLLKTLEVHNREATTLGWYLAIGVFSNKESGCPPLRIRVR